jgi:hypothetical protein
MAIPNFSSRIRIESCGCTKVKNVLHVEKKMKRGITLSTGKELLDTFMLKSKYVPGLLCHEVCVAAREHVYGFELPHERELRVE